MVYTVGNTQTVSTGVGFQKPEGIIGRTDKNAPQVQERSIMFAKEKSSAKLNDKPQTVSTGDDLSKGLVICKELENILDKTNILRIDAYRQVVARLIQEYPTVDPFVLYSLFYESSNPEKAKAVEYLKEKEILEEIESKRAKYLMDEIFGESFSDEKNLGLMNLIDGTRFNNFGWLWGTHYEMYLSENYFGKKSLEILSECNYERSLKYLAELESGDIRKFFKYLGEPDHYIIPWVITDAGACAATDLHGCIIARIYLHDSIRNIIGLKKPLFLERIIERALPFVIPTTDKAGLLTVKEIYGQEILNTLFLGRIKRDNVELIKTLIEVGADVNAKNSDGYTALTIAAAGGLRPSTEKDVELIETLIKAGADVNAKSSDGSTALTMAVRDCNAEVVRLLINAGAKTDIRFGDGMLLLDYARKLGNEEIIRILVEAQNRRK